MPLPNDEKLIALSEEILKQLEAVFRSHPGFRPVHAKGILLTGTFISSSAAANKVQFLLIDFPARLSH
jgi:catalase